MIVDKSCIQQVLGGLIKKPSILSETEKYNLTVQDFSSTFEKTIFAAINNLYNNGARSINIVDIENSLTTNDTAKKIFENNNGIEYLQDIDAFVDEGNFDYYYNKLKKINLLRDFQHQGISTREFYIEDLSDEKAYEVNSKFEDLTIQDIVDGIKKRVLGLESSYLQNDVTETRSAAEGIKDLFNNMKEGYSGIGMPLQGRIYNAVVSGARKGALYIRSAGSGTGKALPNSTTIPTPNGYKCVGEIKVGDYLFDAFGKPTKVLGVYPQGRKEVNFVRFKDGRVSLCCDEHLWSYCTAGQRDIAKAERKFYTKTLKELKQEKLKTAKGAYNILVPMNYAVEYPEQKFYIPPYIFGLALGDGSFRQQESNKSFQFSSENEFLPNYIGQTMGWTVKKNSAHNSTWHFAIKEKQSNQFDKVNVWVEDFLKEYPSLINCKSEDKYIPSNYLLSSIEQRFDLLNGLLDSDGTVDKKGRIRYTTNSKLLRDNIIELAHSLGFKTTILIDNHKNTSICYNIEITGRPDDKIKLFKLPRKKALIEQWYNSETRKESNEFNPIIEIGSCGYTEEMTCFYVDNEEHLFLTNDYIVTHNTRQAVGDACYLAYPFRYEWSTNEWEQMGYNENVLFIATEQDFPEIQKMILAYISGINEDRFKYGNFSDLEREVISKSIEIMERYKESFHIVRMPNPTIGLVKNIIRENCLIYNISYVFYDYIFIGPSLLNEFKGFALRNDEVLLLFATALKDLAVEQNVCVMTSTQLNAKGDDNQNIRNESSLAGGRSTINKADVGAIMARPTKEELEVLKDAASIFPHQPNIVTDIYKIRSGTYSQTRIWSYVDLGTLRKTDMFITDSRLEPIEFDTHGLEYINNWEEDKWDEIRRIARELNGL